MYRYFISFTCLKNGGICNGNTVISLGLPIESMDEINYVQDKIVKDNNVKNVIINNFILLKETRDDDKCLHCGKHEPKYCEGCFQDLITQNMKLQLELNDIKGRYHIPPLPHIVTSNPYVTTGPIYGIDYGEDLEEGSIEITKEFGTWKPKEFKKIKEEIINEAKTHYDLVMEEYVKSKQKEGETDGKSI